MTVYKVAHINGKFTHIKGKREAVQAARGMVGAGDDVSLDDLIKEWGIRIHKISKVEAQSLGF